MISAHPDFAFLSGYKVNNNNTTVWRMDNPFWNYRNEEVKQLQIMFVGKTGYGKSTTLNRITGEDVFPTSDVKSCTRTLSSVHYRLDEESKSFLALCDLPGVGEFKKNDEKYIDLYKTMMKYSHCIVYLLRADQRDFSVDQYLFEKLFKRNEQREGIVIALNCADKVAPINRDYCLSKKQLSNLRKKKQIVSAKFGVATDKVVAYSAADNLNIDLLMAQVAKILRNRTRNFRHVKNLV